MNEEFEHDVLMLKDWLRYAWRRISDPAITAYEGREIRNYMKQAEAALRSGLKQARDRDEVARAANGAALANPRPEFRIIQLVT